MTPHPPSRILFATDLSSRCDRALDRTVQLGLQWRARATALTVIEASAAGQDLSPVGGPRRAPLDAARHRLRADLAVEELPFDVRVEQGAVADTVLSVAAGEQAGLIITGVARNEALSRALLGSTVDVLVRRAAAPVLVVRTRARAAYPRVRVATDLSEAAGHTLRSALAFFPQAQLTLFHAFERPWPVLPGMDATQATNAGLGQAREAVDAWLQGCALNDEQRRRVHVDLAWGDPALLLYEHSLRHPEDLLVLSRLSRGPLSRLLLGSVTQRTLENAEADVLVVPTPGA